MFRGNFRNLTNFYNKKWSTYFRVHIARHTKPRHKADLIKELKLLTHDLRTPADLIEINLT